MSREVIGEAPVFAEQPAPSPALRRPPVPRAGARPDGVAVDVRIDQAAPARRFPRRVVVAGLVALTAASAGAGYVRGGAATATGTDVTAAVVSARLAASARVNRPTRAVVTIGLVNPGSEDVRVDGWVSDTFSSGGSADPEVTVPARGRAELTAEVALRCDQPQDLGVPAMRLRTRDRGGRSLQPVGAAAALTDLCAAGAPVMRTLRSFRLESGGSRLVIELGTQDRRPTRIEAVSAGSVPLDVGPLPARVGGAYPLMIQPPGFCPSTWDQQGLPTTLQIQVDSGSGPAMVTVPVGFALARWALDTSCTGGR